MNAAPETMVYRAASETLAREHPELAWLDPARARALEHFVAAGFPDTGDEDWRYTDLREAAARSAGYLAAPGPHPLPAAASLAADLMAGDHALAVLFVNGTIRTDLSSPPAATPGLTIRTLREVPPDGRAEILELLDDPTGARAAPLTSLNAALLRDALIVDLSPGTVLQRPLYFASLAQPGVTTQTRIILRLGAGSEATAIEHHLSHGAGLANAVTDVRCGPGAKLTYIKLQDESDEGIHLASQTCTLAAQAEIRLVHIDLGARLARNDLRVALSGAGSTVDAHGLFIADGARHLDNHTRIDHIAGQTRSRELYRGIVDQHGRGVFNGKVIVHKEAQKADARLTNQNLLLARTAEVDTKPELEIYADDVKCSHGATTGQLDSGAIFYLRSRGIGAEAARRMLIAAFAREIIAAIPAGDVSRHILERLQARLPELSEQVSAS